MSTWGGCLLEFALKTVRIWGEIRSNRPFSAEIRTNRLFRPPHH